MHFANRQEAGRKLAKALRKYKGKDVIIYALPRGGVVLGFEVAKSLDSILDLEITRKIGHPSNPEYAVCAVAEDGTLLCHQDEESGIDSGWLKQAVKNELQEATRRRQTYLDNRKHISATGKTAIIVDDGVATGLTIQAAVQSIRKEKPAKLIVAVPVAPYEVAEILRGSVDEMVVLDSDKNYLGAVGAYYTDFPQVTDEEVIDLLKRVVK